MFETMPLEGARAGRAWPRLAAQVPARAGPAKLDDLATVKVGSAVVVVVVVVVGEAHRLSGWQSLAHGPGWSSLPRENQTDPRAHGQPTADYRSMFQNKRRHP